MPAEADRTLLVNTPRRSVLFRRPLPRLRHSVVAAQRQTKTGISAGSLPSYTGLSSDSTCAASMRPTGAYSLTAGITAASITLSGGVGMSNTLPLVPNIPVAYFNGAPSGTPASSGGSSSGGGTSSSSPSSGGSSSSPASAASSAASSAADALSSLIGRRRLLIKSTMPVAAAARPAHRRELITFPAPPDVGPFNLCAKCFIAGAATASLRVSTSDASDLSAATLKSFAQSLWTATAASGVCACALWG